MATSRMGVVRGRQEKRKEDGSSLYTVLSTATYIHVFMYISQGYLIYYGTACPQTLSPSTVAELNNHTKFEMELPRIGLIARGDDCSWSTKLTHTKVTADKLNETISGVIVFDNQTVASSTRSENDITGTFDFPAVFVNRSIGLSLLDSVMVANTASSLTNLTVLSQVTVHYELVVADDDDGSLLENASPFRGQEPTSRWILAGQWIINSVAVAFIIGLVAYAYRRLKGRKSESSQRRNLQEDLSTVGSQAASILAPGSADQNSMRETEEQALGREKLEQYPKIEYDPRVIRNSICAICLEHFCQKSPKLLRMLNCNHGFCVHCIGKSENGHET